VSGTIFTRIPKLLYIQKLQQHNLDLLEARDVLATNVVKGCGGGPGGWQRQLVNTLGPTTSTCDCI